MRSFCAKGVGPLILVNLPVWEVRAYPWSAEYALHDQDYDTDVAVGDRVQTDGHRGLVWFAWGAQRARSVRANPTVRPFVKSTEPARGASTLPPVPDLPPSVPPRRAVLWWLVALGVVVFAMSAALAARGLSTFEWELFEVFNDVPVPLAWALLAVMPLGSGEAAMIVPVVFVALRRWELAMVTGLAGPGAWLLAQLGKAAELRGRPIDLLEAFAPTSDATGAGFPSGHTAVAVAFTVAVWPYLPRPVRPVVVAVAAAVAFARMHVGVHLPLDLVGGAGIGLGAGAIAVLLVTTRRDEAVTTRR